MQTRVARFDDQQAYKELFLILYSPLFNFVAAFVKSKPVAEEIVSDVFLKLWEKRADLERIANLRVYCFVSAKNMALNHIERESHLRLLNIDDFAPGLQSLYIDPEQLMITGEMADRIRHAVDALPARCRMIFTLVRENGFKYREAAEILHLSEKTVENQLAIAVKKIGAAIGFDLARAVPVI